MVDSQEGKSCKGVHQGVTNERMRPRRACPWDSWKARIKDPSKGSRVKSHSQSVKDKKWLGKETLHECRSGVEVIDTQRAHPKVAEGKGALQKVGHGWSVETLKEDTQKRAAPLRIEEEGMMKDPNLEKIRQHFP